MSTLTIHDVQQTNLENQKFDFLLHCNTCGWEGRGFNSIGPTSAEMKNAHIGYKLAQDQGDGDAVTGKMDLATAAKIGEKGASLPVNQSQAFAVPPPAEQPTTPPPSQPMSAPPPPTTQKASKQSNG